MLYKLLKPILSLFIKLYRPTIINNKIPDKCILAGNHTSYLDPILIAITSKKQIHFFAKSELCTGFKKIIFNNLGIIPVNRKIKDKNALNLGREYLKNDNIICIFPEGTINRSKDIILPFKFGAVKLALDTNTEIIPFAIINKYKFLRKSVKIVYGNRIKIGNNLEEENKRLESIIKDLIEVTK